MLAIGSLHRRDRPIRMPERNATTRLVGHDDNDAFAEGERQMRQAGVAAQHEGGQFHQPGGHEQRHAGGHGKSCRPRRFQRLPFGRAAAEQYLQPARAPVSGHRQITGQRPVLLGELVNGWMNRVGLSGSSRFGEKFARRLDARPPAGQIRCGWSWFSDRIGAGETNSSPSDGSRKSRVTPWV